MLNRSIRQSGGGILVFLVLLAVSAQAQSAPPEANYDEAKVGAYTLPDPLVMRDGNRVSRAQQWRKRRAEILGLFESQVYGRTPSKRFPLRSQEKSRDEAALGGLAVRREIAIQLTHKPGGPVLNLLLYVPKRRSGRAPVFLGMNFNGNQAVHAEPGIALAASWMRDSAAGGVVGNRATEKARGTEASRWQAELVVSRGYALATFYYGDLFPDHKDGRKDSIIPHISGDEARADDWNAIGAWAWGLSRALDYLERDRDVDARRVAVIGHSRLGKAALWAGAQDERFAMVVSNNSGEGGAALARRNFGETVARINWAFPHWFCANFKPYGQRVNDLPVDQHMLIALAAPRPIYIASAVEDQWADPRGEFLSGLHASPVYKLLGKDGLGAAEMPGIHQPVMTTIGYHLRAGKHDVTRYDWEQFLNFADQHLRSRGR
jgi:hypothetical protein